MCNGMAFGMHNAHGVKNELMHNKHVAELNSAFPMRFMYLLTYCNIVNVTNVTAKYSYRISVRMMDENYSIGIWHIIQCSHCNIILFSNTPSIQLTDWNDKVKIMDKFPNATKYLQTQRPGYHFQRVYSSFAHLLWIQCCMLFPMQYNV